MSVPLVLPNSKIVMPMQLTGYYMAIEGSEHGSRGIQPDIPVEYSIADILAGKDKEMEVALGRLARRAGDAPSTRGPPSAPAK